MEISVYAAVSSSPVACFWWPECGWCAVFVEEVLLAAGGGGVVVLGGVLSSWVWCCEVGVWFAGDGLASLVGVRFFLWLNDLRRLIWVMLRGVATRAWFLCGRRCSNRFWYL